MAKPYVATINWTKGIDQKTGKPVDYDPAGTCRSIPGLQNQTPAQPTKQLVVPVDVGRQQLLPAVLQPPDQADVYPGDRGLQRDHAGPEREASRRASISKPKLTRHQTLRVSDLVVADPVTGRRDQDQGAQSLSGFQRRL